MQCLFCRSVFTAFNCRFLQSSSQACHILFLEYVNSEMQNILDHFGMFWGEMLYALKCFKLFQLDKVIWK